MQAPAAHIAGHSNNRDPWIVLTRTPEHESFAHRILSRPVAIGEGLIDDRGARSAIAIAIVQETAAYQTDPHGVEEARRSRVYGGFNLLGGRERSAIL